MSPDTALLLSLALFAVLVAFPALAAARRREAMREASDVACALSSWAAAVRESPAIPPLDESLRRRTQRLHVPEFASLLLAHELPRPCPRLLADTAQRLSLRMKRRVAFERKMLARTAPGRRRGAVAASVPAVLLLLLYAGGVQFPLAALALVVAIEACGCWLLWRVAQVQI